MKALRQKLKSKQGASIIIVMVFFLFCAMVGIVVLTSANANAGRLSHMKTEQQAYLTVSSAARLLQEELADTKYNLVTEETVVRDHQGNILSEDTVTTQELQPASGALSALLEDWAYDVCSQHGSGPLTRDPSTFVVEAPEMEAVAVEFSMDEDHTLTIVLELDGQAGAHSMVLVMPATFSDKSASKVQEGIDGGGRPYTITTTTHTHAVHWKAGEIAKEGVD